MKKGSNSPTKKEQTSKRAKSQRSVHREMKEVLAEVVEKLEGKAGAEDDAGEPRRRRSTN